jgi:callose synthase
MSFYYGGIGHYIANTMVMFTLVVVVYSMLGLAVFKEEGVNGRPMHPEGVLQLLLAGLGLLQTMPLVVTLTVEKGIISAINEISYMFLSGGPLYFIFHIQTKCYYFSQTLMTGGAAYRPTGRGFVIRHSPFDENYRFFATSHIYLGFELMIALVIFAMHTKSKQYSGLTWSLWLTSVSFLLGPFWFNPLTFEWNRLKEDYVQWITWMAETGGSSDLSWAVWWREENSIYKELSFSWKCFLFVQKSCTWLFISVGLLQSRFFRDPDEQRRLLYLFLLFMVYIFGHWCISKLERSLSYAVRRFTSLTLSSAVAVTGVYFFVSHTLYLRYSLAMYYLCSSVCAFCLISGVGQVSAVYKLHDYVVGHTIFLILTILSTLQVLRYNILFR